MLLRLTYQSFIPYLRQSIPDKRTILTNIKNSFINTNFDNHAFNIVYQKKFCFNNNLQYLFPMISRNRIQEMFSLEKEGSQLKVSTFKRKVTKVTKHKLRQKRRKIRRLSERKRKQKNY